MPEGIVEVFPNGLGHFVSDWFAWACLRCHHGFVVPREDEGRLFVPSCPRCNCGVLFMGACDRDGGAVCARCGSPSVPAVRLIEVPPDRTPREYLDAAPFPLCPACPR